MTKRISTNTLLAEGDESLVILDHGGAEFQPTPSSRRVTYYNRGQERRPGNFNQHPPRGG